jgi:hypothetical protein
MSYDVSFIFIDLDAMVSSGLIKYF